MNAGDEARVPWASIVAIAVLPCALALVMLGRVHPDEVFQFLEPAYFRVHGYGQLAWEWHDGLRNWVSPLVLAAVFEVCDRLGLEHPLASRAAIGLLLATLNAGMLVAAYRYVARRAGGTGARVAVLAIGLLGPVVLYSGRTLGESISTAFLVIAFERLDRSERPLRSAAWAGLALGAAVVARYGSLAIVSAALVHLAVAREWRRLAFACAAGALVAAALGAADWLAWGRPFHSLLAYAGFNVFSSGAEARFGEDDAWLYAAGLAKYLPAWVLVGLPIAIASFRPRVALPLVGALAYLAVVCVVGHKETRFLYPAIVLLALAAAPGMAAAVMRTRRVVPWAAAVVVLSSVSLLWPERLFWRGSQQGDQFRAVVAATRTADVTGLLLVNVHPWGHGGHSLVGRPIPILTAEEPRDPRFLHAIADPRVNRVVAYEGVGVDEIPLFGFREVARSGDAIVFARSPSLSAGAGDVDGP